MMGRRVLYSYASRCLTKAERKNCVIGEDCQLKNHLKGGPFVVSTHHSSLKWLLNKSDVERQMARWLHMEIRVSIELASYIEMQML